MDLNIRITLDAPRGGIARVARSIALPIALVLAAALGAYALDTDWIVAGSRFQRAN